MEIIKKNIVSVICGVVALAAIAVAFTMLPGRAAQLQQQLDARRTTYESMHQLLTKPRQLPSVNPDDPSAQQALPQFPSAKIIEAGTAITKQVTDESNDIVKAAVEMNRHDLLYPGSLPAPNNPQAISFRNAYLMSLPLPTAGGVMKSRFAQELNAGMPPTPEDLQKRVADLTAELKKKIFINAQGQPTNEQQVQQELTEKSALIPKQMSEETAATKRVYVNPETFEIYPQIAAAPGAPDPIHIYYAQLSYWIQQDVVNAVNDANANSKSIKDSPVKHLVSIRAHTGGVPNFIAIPGQANSDPDGALTANKAVSPTGRVCNGLYDVFHFTVNVDVEAAKVGEFLRALGNRRFITPLSADVKAVDNAVELSHGHAYGEKPMLNLTIECEVLYLRKWNAPLMPQAIKTALGIPSETGTPAPAAAPAQPAASAQ